MEKEPTFRSLELLSKIALKCYCCPRLRLSSFSSAGRGGLESREGWRGEQAASGVGSLCMERMSCILHLGSGKGMLSLGTLTVRLADGFLLFCSPGMVRL